MFHKDLHHEIPKGMLAQLLGMVQQILQQWLDRCFAKMLQDALQDTAAVTVTGQHWRRSPRKQLVQNEVQSLRSHKLQHALQDMVSVRRLHDLAHVSTKLMGHKFELRRAAIWDIILEVPTGSAIESLLNEILESFGHLWFPVCLVSEATLAIRTPVCLGRRHLLVIHRETPAHRLLHLISRNGIHLRTLKTRQRDAEAFAHPRVRERSEGDPMIPHGHEAGNRICHLGWHVLVHVLVHVLLHVLLHVLDILLVESHHALHDLEVPSLLLAEVKIWLRR
mmetsp:Transcript_22445/g.49157  ORF Transcript_22445/g.49157 Transcript_22445/m.49157 type:complete len:279 (+) Transcript_22445:408-1244(+)